MDVNFSFDYPNVDLKSFMLSLQERLSIIQKVSKEVICRNQQMMKRLYDKKAKSVDYKAGNLVWVYIPVVCKGLTKKLSSPWCGPYLILERRGRVDFKVKNLATGKVMKSLVHANRIKPAVSHFERPNVEVHCPDVILEDADINPEDFASPHPVKT